MKKLMIVFCVAIGLPSLLQAEEKQPAHRTNSTIADSADIQRIEVYSTRTRVHRNILPLTLSVVTRSQIENSSESSLLPVLSQQVPGLFVTQKGVTGFGVSTDAAGAVNVRGVGGGNQVLILLDGQPQWAGIFGHALPDMYVASDAERVEVIRGPGSLIYGSNAMGGVVNVITRKPETDGSQTRARVLFGSYNTQKYLLNNGYRHGRFSSFVSINHDRTDGHRPDSRFRITNGYANLGYELSEHYKLTGNLSLADIHSQNPGEIDDPILDNIMDILRGSASVALENTHATHDGALRLFYNWGHHKIDDGYSPGDQPRNDLFRSNDHHLGAMLYQTFRPFQGNRITGGIDYKNWGGHAWYIYRDGSPRSDLVDRTIHETAAYLSLQQDIAKLLTLSAGVRYEHNSRFGGVWVPQAGFSFRPTETTTLRGSFSKGFRSPNIREMYMFPPQNPDLEPENMLNYDLTFAQTFWGGRLSTELTAFFIDGRNLIETVRANGRPTNLNTGKFINKGIEFDLHYRADKDLSVDANYSYLSTSRPLLAAPRHKAFAGATYTPGRFTLNVNLQVVSRLYTRLPSADESAAIQNNYTLLGARVAYHFGPLERGLNLFVKGENLTAARYTINYGFPMPRALVFGGVDLTF